MIYVQMHLGDWLAGTSLLTATERGVYFDLITQYYVAERPLSTEECTRIARAYAPAEAEAMQFVLKRFFRFEDGFYHHSRCDKEIKSSTSGKFGELSLKKKRAAWLRWHKGEPFPPELQHADDAGAMQDAMQVDMQKDARADATNNPITNNPITNIEEKESKKERHAITQAFNLSSLPSDWSDYCKQVRPDLNPQTVFLDFAFYFTKGQGKDNRRSEKGWAQSWQGWVRRQKEVRAPKAPQEPKSFADIDYSVGINPDGSF